MNIENRRITPEETENTDNILSENEEFQEKKKEKREAIEDQEKFEEYMSYLVEWKNEIVRKQEEVKNKVDDIINENMGRFFDPTPERNREPQFRGADTLFSDLAEQFNEIQVERNLWAKKVSSTIAGTIYDPGDSYYPDPDPKIVERFLFIPSKGNDKIVKLIEELGLSRNSYSTVGIPKEVLAEKLPLHKVDEDEHSRVEKWLRINDDEFVVTFAEYEKSDDNNFVQKDFRHETYHSYNDALVIFENKNNLYN